MARLLLVRHGITEHNSNRQFAGNIDVELSPDGYRQAEKLGDRLAGEKIDAVYSSDLKRAVATAEIIASRHDVAITQRPEIREMNYGEAEGMSFSEIRQCYPEVAASIFDFNVDLSFPGGDSFKEFAARACGFLETLEDYREEQTVLIVTHGGVLKVMVCDLMGIDHSHFQQIRFDNASLSIVYTYPGRVILSLLNDTSHLKEG